MDETPFLGHDPIPMRRVDGYDDVEQPGDFWWTRAEGGPVIWIALPPSGWAAERGHRFNITPWTINHKNSCDAQWSWDGDEDSPTLTPSLHCVGYWHGWVRGGMRVEAGKVDPDL